MTDDRADELERVTIPTEDGRLLELSRDELGEATFRFIANTKKRIIDLGNLPDNTTKTVEHGISNLGTIDSIAGIAKKEGNDKSQIAISLSNNTDDVQIFLTDTGINITTTADYSDYVGTLIIYYIEKRSGDE